MKRWRKKNKDKINRYWREYRKKHPEFYAKINEKRRLKNAGWDKLKKCKVCENSFIPTIAPQIYCTKAHYLKARPLRLRFFVLEKSNFSCVYCGRKAPEVQLEIEHIIPKSKGGTNKIENLVASCTECNLEKGDILLKS